MFINTVGITVGFDTPVGLIPIQWRTYPNHDASPVPFRSRTFCHY